MKASDRGRNVIKSIQVRQHDTPPYGGGQLKLCATPSPPFSTDGNISVADRMPHLAYPAYVKINGGVQCMKNSRLSTSIWSITAGSNEPSTLGRYASYCVDRRRAIHKCRSAMQQWISRLSLMTMQNALKCNIILLIK